MAAITSVRYTFNVSAAASVGLLNGTSGITRTATVQSTSAAQPVTKEWSASERTIAGSDETIDLTALPNGENFTGLKVQIIQITASSANVAASTITVSKGDSNGYELFGTSTGNIALKPGDIVQISYNDSLADVSGSLKNVKFTCSTTGLKYSICLIAG